MANDTGTVELPPETTEPTDVDTAAAIDKLLSKDSQKSDEQEAPQEQPAPEEQTPPQETEQPPEEPQAPASEVDDEDEPEALPEDVQARIDKRIAKVVAKRKEVEEQLAEREARLAEAEAKIRELSDAPKETAPPPQATPSDSDPLLRVPEIKKIWDEEQKASAAVREASHLLRQFRKDPDAALAEFKERTNLTLDVEDAKDWLESVRQKAQVTEMRFSQQRGIATERHIAKLEQESKTHHDTALKAYPALADKNSKEGKMAQEILNRFPALLNAASVPDGWLILADLVSGRLQREAKASAPAAPKAPPPAPPKLAAPAKTAAPTTRTNGKPQVSALRKQALESGDPMDIARVIEASPLLASR